jgi:NADH-quinone oxidoreductase subunit N
MSAFNNLLIFDAFSTFAKILIVTSAIVCIFMSMSYLEYKKVNSFEYFILLLLAVLGMICLVSSNDLLSIYMSIELMSLSFYILAAYKRNSEFSGEAGLKYFILGAFSSGLLLFGISMIYGFTGLTNFEELAKLLTGINGMVNSVTYNGIVIGILFLTVSLLFKVAAAPFHMWSPDVYEGAPTPVTAFFSIVPKMAVIALMTRLFYSTFFDFISFWQPILLYSGILSMIIGSIGALYQKKIKRLMAYSGIANVGYMLAGLGSGTVESVAGLMLYLIIYVVMTMGFFSFVLGTQAEKDSKLNMHIADLVNLGKVNPVLAISVTLILFSMVGLPPLAGFFGKFYLFLAMIQSELYVVAIIGILSSVVAAFYYIRIIKIMFFGTSGQYTTYKSMDKLNTLVLSSSLFFLVFLFAYPHPFLLCIHKMSLGLCL